MTAGYSGTPLPQKLGIKPGHRLLLLYAPEPFELDIPEGVKVGRAARGKADVIISFHTERADLARRMPKLRAAMEPAAGLWIAWPKRASKVPTDLTENVVRELALANAAGGQQGRGAGREVVRPATGDQAARPLASSS